MTKRDESSDHSDAAYPVRKVAGHPPQGLDDVVGATTVTVEHDGREYRLRGTGSRGDDGVLFQQKEVGSASDDGPTWTIRADESGLIAEPPTDA